MRIRDLHAAVCGMALIACTPAAKPVAVTPNDVADSDPIGAGEPTGTPATTEPDLAKPHARVVGETAIDLGGGRSLRLSPDATMRLGDAIVGYGLEFFQANVYETVRVGDDTIVVFGVGIVDKPNDPGSLIAVRVDAGANKLVWHDSIGPQSFDPRPPDLDWKMMLAGDRLVLIEKGRVLAIDVATGKQAWAFSSIDPTFSEGYLAGVGVTRESLQFDGAELRGEVLVLRARATDGKSRVVEIDRASGRRVYHQVERVPARPRTLFGFSKTMHAPFTRDDPPPPPPPDPPPAGFDGLIVGYTSLLWSTRTGRGIIVNPTADANGEILATARAQRVTLASGKQTPITWTMAIDSATLADAVLAAGSKYRQRRPPSAKSVVFDYGLGLFQNGEVVELDAVANALGARAVRSPKDLPAGQREVTLERVPGETNQARIVWGPIIFEDYASGGPLVVVVTM